MLIAVTAMFLQQTCGSIARALPAVLAPLIIAELHADAAWVGIYFSLTAFAGLIGQLGSGGFIIRHGAIRMSQIALLFTGAGLAVAVLGGAVGFGLSAFWQRRCLRCNPGQFPVAGALVRRALCAICFLHCPVRDPGRHSADRLSWPPDGTVVWLA